MQDRWSVDRVTATASDASSLSAGRGLATPARWAERGCAPGTPESLWGLCKGSGSKPYQTCVDLDEPAFRCTCPSRKFPCKHALGLLFMWAAGDVDEQEPPDWVREWHEGRAVRAIKAQARRAAAPAEQTDAQRKAAARRAAQRVDRVAGGVAELGQWLDDQIRHGIVGLDRAGYHHWDAVAAHLVDAQAPGLAGRVRSLAGVASSGEGWDERLLGEFGMLRLLTKAYDQIDLLPEPLADSIRSHVGFTVPADQVLTRPPLRDTWQVIGSRDDVDERMTTRRTWLRGRDSDYPALVLSFAMAGQALPSDLPVGVEVDADVCFYPGAAPLRAMLNARHAPVTPFHAPARADTLESALSSYSDGLAQDPWLGLWPMVIEGTLAPGDPWRLVDTTGASVRLLTGLDEPWAMYAAAGGHPAPISGEWSPPGFRPLAMFMDGEVISA